MRVSPTEYSAATRAATWIVSGLYFGAGILVGISTRRVELTGILYALALLAAILVCNGVLLLFQRVSLPKVERQLNAAIAARDGPAFARHIIRREMAKILQPVGGIAFTLAFLAEAIVSRRVH